MADPDPVTLKQLSAPQEAVLPDREFAKRFPWYKPVDYFIKGLEENRQGRGQVFDRGDDQTGPGSIEGRRSVSGVPQREYERASVVPHARFQTV